MHVGQKPIFQYERQLDSTARTEAESPDIKPSPGFASTFDEQAFEEAIRKTIEEDPDGNRNKKNYQDQEH